jgi:hypothetical protein
MGIRFFIDENFWHNLAEGLRLLGHNVEHLLDHFDPGTKDEVWLKYVGKNKLALITKDKQIRRRPKRHCCASMKLSLFIWVERNKACKLLASN